MLMISILRSRNVTERCYARQRHESLHINWEGNESLIPISSKQNEQGMENVYWFWGCFAA